MIDVRLYGRLGEICGERHTFAGHTPRVILSALTRQVAGFKKEFLSNKWRLAVGDFEIDETALDLPFGKNKTLHITPDSAGGGTGLELFLGGLLLGSAAIAIGSLLLFPQHDPNEAENENEQTTTLFSRPVNTTSQGHPLPIVLGTFRIGSRVASSSLEVVELTDSATATNSTGGFTGSGGLDDGVFYEGRKGGKSGGGGAAAEEEPNSLQAEATARIVDVLASDFRLTDGMKSVYFDDVPLQNADNSFNFSGVTLTEREGLPVQDPIAGFDRVYTLINVNTQVTNATPVTRTITDADADAVIVTLGVPSLFDEGKRTSVSMEIQLQSAGGGFTTVARADFDGKTNSRYQRNYEIALPAAGAPWDVRVRRITPDNGTLTLQNDTYFETMQIVEDTKLTYPNTALVALAASAKQFGGDIPTRSFEGYASRLPIPTNYDPQARNYSGVWNGTLTVGRTDNPAWCILGLLTDEVNGLGLPIEKIDVYSFYDCAVYCDELVSDGRGGSEPRFTTNGYIQVAKSGKEWVDTVASAARMSIIHSGGLIQARQDRQKDVSHIVSPANVIDGKFARRERVPYSERKSSVRVTWNDPTDNYSQAVAGVESPQLVDRYGLKEAAISAFGCTSYGQAQRTGLWYLEDQETSGERIEWEAAWDQLEALPGDIVELSDPANGAETAGRLKSVSGTTLELDRPVTIVADLSIIRTLNSAGDIVEANILNASGDHTVLITDTATDAQPNFMYSVTTPSSNAELVRIVSIEELETDRVKVTAESYDPDKFDRVENGIRQRFRYNDPTPSGSLPPPSDLQFSEFFEQVGDTIEPAVTFSWSPPNDGRVLNYQAQIQIAGAADFEPLGGGRSISRTKRGTVAGLTRFRVRSVTGSGLKSGWVGIETTLIGMNAALNPPVNLTKSVSNEFQTTRMVWAPPLGEVRPVAYRISFNTTNDFNTATFLGATKTLEWAAGLFGFYFIETTFAGKSSAPASVEISQADAPTITSTNLASDFNDYITGTGAYSGGSGAGSGNVYTSL